MAGSQKDKTSLQIPNFYDKVINACSVNNSCWKFIDRIWQGKGL